MKMGAYESTPPFSWFVEQRLQDVTYNDHVVCAPVCRKANAMQTRKNTLTQWKCACVVSHLGSQSTRKYRVTLVDFALVSAIMARVFLAKLTGKLPVTEFLFYDMQ